MNHLVKYTSFFIALLISLTSYAQVTWDGGGDGINWSDANNWNGNTLPGDNDDVIISNGDVVEVDYDTNANLDDLTISGGSTLRILTNGFVDLDGNGVLTITGASTLEIAGGELDSDDDIIINGGSTVTVSSGTLDITGDGATIDDATINLSGGLIDFGADIFLTNSTVNVSGGEFNIDGGDFTADNTDTNVTGGFMDLNDDLELSNNSTFNISGGLVDVSDQLDANNSDITLSGGELESGIGGNDQVDLDNGATFTMTGGVLDVEDIAVDNSDFTVSGGTVTGNDVFMTGTGNMTISNGDITLDDFDATDNSTVSMTGGNVTIDDLDTTGNSDFTVDGSDLTMDNAVIQGNSTVNFDNGNITTTGRFETNDTATLNIDTTLTSNSNNVNDDLDIFGSSTVNIGPNGVVSGFDDVDMTDADAGTATLNINGGSLTVDDDVNFDGSNNDAINISGGGTLTIPDELDINTSNGQITVTDGNIDAGDIVDDTAIGGEVSDNNLNVTGSGTISEGGTVVLPVELVKFEGSVTKGVVILDWITASEVNNDRFDVQKSTDGEQFLTIGTIEGMGTTSELQEYSFTDFSASVGISYYRLMQYDYDGASEALPTIAIHNGVQAEESRLNVFPNPVITDEINVQLSGQILLEGYEVQLYDLNGKIIFEQHYNAGISQFRIEDLRSKAIPGNYVLKINGAQDALYKQIILK